MTSRVAVPADAGFAGVGILSNEDYEREFHVAYHTRLGELCGAGEPAVEQKIMAFEEAEKHVENLKRQGV